MDFTGKVTYSKESYAQDITENLEIPVYGSTNPIIIEPAVGIEGIPVVLISTSTWEGVCIKTAADGSYGFTNVPAGNYNVIEAFGYTGPGAHFDVSTIDYDLNKVEIGNNVIPKDPDVQYISSAGLDLNGGDKIISLEPNMKPIRVGSNYVAYNPTNLVGNMWVIQTVDFKDAPQNNIYIEGLDEDKYKRYFFLGANKISVAGKGTFGTGARGVDKNQSFDGEFSSENISDFTPAEYGGTRPTYGEYSIVNIAAKSTFANTWHDSADHTYGDETGRFMIINGNDEVPVFFRASISVTPNKSYWISCWVMNMLRNNGSDNPKFSINAYDVNSYDEENKTPLFSVKFNGNNELEMTPIPTWKQFGAIVIPSQFGDVQKIVLEFTSDAPEATGNDYAIDDIFIKELSGVIAEKNTNKTVAKLKDEIKYTCMITNGGAGYLGNFVFKDQLPAGVSIKNNELTISCSNIKNKTFTISGKSELAAGISLGEKLAAFVESDDPEYDNLSKGYIPPFSYLTLEFTVVVDSLDGIGDDGVLYNSYRTDFLSSDEAYPRTVISNTVATLIQYPVLNVTKKAFRTNGKEIPPSEGVICGTDIVYEITITNTGFADVESVKITDDFDIDYELRYSENEEECGRGVTSQIISPLSLAEEDEKLVPCADIVRTGNRLEINNILVPKKISQDEPGICTVRIYGKAKCKE